MLDAEPDAGTKAELLRALAEASCRIDRPIDAIRAASEAAELFAGLDRPADRAQSIYWLAAAQHLQDNPDEARSLFAGLLAEVRAGLIVTPDFELKLLVVLAGTETYRGAHEAAVGYLEEARAMSADLDDRRRGLVLFNLANGYRGAGDNEAAIRYGSQALTLLRAAEADLEAAMLENNLALAYLAIGSTDRAAELVREAQAIGRRHDDDRLLAHLADTEAQVALAAGQPERALELAQAAIERAEATGGSKAAVDGWTTLARRPARGWPARPGVRRLRQSDRARPHQRPGPEAARGAPGVGRCARRRRPPRRGVRARPRGAVERGTGVRALSRCRPRRQPPDDPERPSLDAGSSGRSRSARTRRRR